MRIGFSSSYMPLETIADIDYSFQACEIVTDWPFLSVNKCKEFLTSFLQFKRSYNEFKFLLHAPMRDVNIFSFVPEIKRVSLEILKEILDVASMFDIEIVTVHSGYIPDYDFDLYKPVMLDSFAKCNKYLADYDIVLAIENIYEFFGETLNNILKLASSVMATEKIKLTYDAGHANIVGRESQSEFIRKIQNSIVNVHLHDNDGSDDEHLALGKGTLPLKDIIVSLKRTGYNGALIIENKSMKEALESREKLCALLKEVVKKRI